MRFWPQKTTFYNYREYINSSHFDRLRSLVSGRPCWICHTFEAILPHHVSYDNLGKELLYSDVYPICFSCHQEIHFSQFGKEKVLLQKGVLLNRMKLLKRTYRIRKFRLGAVVNTIVDYLFSL